MDLPVVKLDFVDFWEGFEKENSNLPRFLKKFFRIEISNQPDFLIYSVFGNSNRGVRSKRGRIFYTPENYRPDFHQCDFSISFDYLEDKRNIRLPLYRLYFDEKDLIKPRSVDLDDFMNRKDCCMVVSNHNAPERLYFFHLLHKRIRVDSGGKVLNNIGYLVPDKLEFLKNYKFVISFENSIYPGYLTEKIAQPWICGCIPIYWGDPLVKNEVNGNCFINLNDYGSFNQAVEHINSLRGNKVKIAEYLAEPFYENNVIPFELSDDYYKQRLHEIFLP